MTELLAKRKAQDGASSLGVEDGMSLTEIFEELSLRESPKLLEVIHWQSVGKEVLVLIAD